jgi:hypothetical protein
MKLQMLWIFYQHGDVTGGNASRYAGNMLIEFYDDIYVNISDPGSGPEMLAFMISVVNQPDEVIPLSMMHDLPKGNKIRRRNRWRLLYRIIAFMVMTGTFHTFTKYYSNIDHWKTRMGMWGCALLGATTTVEQARCTLNRIEYSSGEKLDAIAHAKTADNIETLAYLSRRFLGWQPATHGEYATNSQTRVRTVLLLAGRFGA